MSSDGCSVTLLKELANATTKAEKLSSSKVEIVRLADELSSQKAAQELLKEELSHAQKHINDLRKQNTISNDENQRLEERLIDLQSKAPQIDLPCRPEELYELWSKAEAGDYPA
eukprot:751672-Hanusia_phi.AAC.4